MVTRRSVGGVKGVLRHVLSASDSWNPEAFKLSPPSTCVPMRANSPPDKNKLFVRCFDRLPPNLKKKKNTTNATTQKMHDEAERDRKRGDGDFRHHRIEEPSLAIHTRLPEDEGRARQEESRVVGLTGNGVDGGRGGEAEESSAVAEGARGADGAQDAWALVAEEVGFRLKVVVAADWPDEPISFFYPCFALFFDAKYILIVKFPGKS